MAAGECTIDYRPDLLANPGAPGVRYLMATGRAPDPSAPLTLAERKRLDAFLRRPTGRISSFEALDGVLAAVLSCPEMVLPSDVMAELPRTASGTSAFRTAEEAQLLLGLLMRHWNTVARALREQDPYSPALDDGVPPRDAGRAWATGYQLGVNMRAKAWQPLREHPFHGQMLRSIFFLAGETAAEPRMAMTQEQSNANERPHHLDALGYNVSAIHRWLRPELFQALDAPPAQAARMSQSDMWMGWGLRENTVKGLFAAAARYYRAAPWNRTDSDPIVDLLWPGGDQWAALVVGEPGMPVGLATYLDPVDLLLVLDAKSDDEAAEALQGVSLNLLFVARDDLDRRQVKEILSHGWEVAAPDAYPNLAILNSPDGTLSESMAERMTQVLTGLARMTEERQSEPTRPRKRRRPVQFTWKDPDTGLGIRGERT
jgi:uncharacterized protein